MILRPRFRAPRTLSAALAAAVLSLALPATASAQGYEPEEERRPAARKGDPKDRFCIDDSGARVEATRARGRGGECPDGAGRAYTREQIERSGSADMRDALRRLESSGR